MLRHRARALALLGAVLCVPVLAHTSDAPSAPARALRVAYIHQHLPLGGVETHILNLCGALNRSLADPTVFLTRTEGPLAGAGISRFCAAGL